MSKMILTLRALSTFCILLAVGGCDDGVFAQKKCATYSKVKSVDSIIHRGGIITLENGERVNVDQPSTEIKVGTNYCVKWER